VAEEVEGLPVVEVYGSGRHGLWEKLELERSVGDTGPGVQFVVEFNLEPHSPDADDCAAPDVSVLAPLDANADGREGGFEDICGSGNGVPAGVKAVLRNLADRVLYGMDSDTCGFSCVLDDVEPKLVVERAERGAAGD